MAAEPFVPVSTGGSSPGFEAAARWVRRWVRALLGLCAVLFCVALAGLTVDIVMRYALSSSVRGMQEIVNLVFIWIFMLGFAALYACNGDAAITFAVRALPVRARIVVAGFVSLLICASMAIVLKETLGLIASQMSIASMELGIPEPVRMASLAVAAASVAVTSLLDAWGCLLWARHGVRPVLWADDVP